MAGPPTSQACTFGKMLRSQINASVRPKAGSALRLTPTRFNASPVQTQICRSTDASRRDVMLAGGIILASPLVIVKQAAAKEQKYLEIDSLGSFTRSDQKTEFAVRAMNALRETLTPADAPACVRLAFHDAGTYDYATKTGGFDGSIATSSEELGRPENADLKELVKRLAAAKKKIDEGDVTGAGPISWADTIYLAGRVTTQAAWADIKTGRAQTPSGGQTIATAFKNAWPLEIGRIDSDTPGPNRVPALDADVETIKQYLLKLGAKPDAGSSPFTPKAPFWERPGFLLWTATAPDPEAEEARFVAAQPDVYKGIKKSFDISKRTVTRTDYEIDFSLIYNKACSLGAKFDSNKYLYRVPVQSIL